MKQIEFIRKKLAEVEKSGVPRSVLCEIYPQLEHGFDIDKKS